MTWPVLIIFVIIVVIIAILIWGLYTERKKTPSNVNNVPVQNQGVNQSCDASLPCESGLTCHQAF